LDPFFVLFQFKLLEPVLIWLIWAMIQIPLMTYHCPSPLSKSSKHLAIVLAVLRFDSSFLRADS
jgi:hypothetical protein